MGPPRPREYVSSDSRPPRPCELQAATDSEETPGGVPIDRQRLLAGPTFEQALEDARQLQELKVENDAVLALVHATEDGGWEPVDVQAPGQAGGADARE